MNTSFRTVRVFILSWITSTIYCVADEVGKEAPLIDPAFIVAATPRYYLDTDIRCRSPHWLYKKQFAGGFPITGVADVFAVIAEPIAIPKAAKPLFLSLTANSNDAQDAAEQSPAVDPTHFFLVLNEDRKPSLILSLGGGVVQAHVAKWVNSEGEFQPDAQWVSFSASSDLVEYLADLQPPAKIPKSAFTAWIEDSAQPNQNQKEPNKSEQATPRKPSD